MDGEVVVDLISDIAVATNIRTFTYSLSCDSFPLSFEKARGSRAVPR